MVEPENKIVTSEVRMAFQDKCDELRAENGRNVQASHFGSFTQDLVMSLSEGVEELMVSMGDHRLVIKRMFSILIEGLQNIRIHGGYDPFSDQQLSYLIVAVSEENYKIVMSNITDAADQSRVESFINKINAYSEEELKDTYRSVLANEFLSQKGGAGLGFITTRMKSGNQLGANFIELSDSQVLFSLEVVLNRIKKK